MNQKLKSKPKSKLEQMLSEKIETQDSLLNRLDKVKVEIIEIEEALYSP